MKVIAVFAAILAVSSAQIIYNGGHLGYAGLGYNSVGLGYGYNPGFAYAAAPGQVVHTAAAPVISAPVVAATKTQYHAQDELGQASFGHSEPTQSHAAVRDAAGGVSGTFSYIGAEGLPYTTHYRADHNGYRVASNALPVASSLGPIDTPEVTAAKIQHAAAHSDALIRAGRAKRGVVSPLTTFGYSAALPVSHHVPASFGYGYSTVAAAPVVSQYSAVSHPLTYSAVSHPVTYSAGHHVVAAPSVYSTAHVGVVPAVRAATLTKVVNTPGHAVSYRVD